MVLDVIVQKSAMSIDLGGGGKDGKVSVIGVLANNPGPIVDKEGMDTFSITISMVGMMCFDVVGPFRS